MDAEEKKSKGLVCDQEGWPLDIFEEKERPPSCWNCGICHLPARRAHVTRCGHLFCLCCIRNHVKSTIGSNFTLTSKAKCPWDQALFSLSEMCPVLGLDQYIDLCCLKCPFHSEGCPWKSRNVHSDQEAAKVNSSDNLGRLRNHLNSECEFCETTCPHTPCEWKGISKKLGDHLIACPFQPGKCDHCQVLLKLKDLPSHLEKCTKCPVACTLGCGAMVPREALSTHLTQQCPLTQVTCSWPSCRLIDQEGKTVLAKCVWTGHRKDLENHQPECLHRPGPCPQQCAQQVPLHYPAALAFHLRDECSETPVPCDQVCDPEKRWPRGQLSSHQKNDCPMTLIPCPFYPFACSEQVRRSQLAQHLSQPEISTLHAKKAHEAVVNLRDRVENLKSRILFDENDTAVIRWRNGNDAKTEFRWEGARWKIEIQFNAASDLAVRIELIDGSEKWSRDLSEHVVEVNLIMMIRDLTEDTGLRFYQTEHRETARGWYVGNTILSDMSSCRKGCAAVYLYLLHKDDE